MGDNNSYLIGTAGVSASYHPAIRTKIEAKPRVSAVPLVLAIKNKSSIVVASDSATGPVDTAGKLMELPGHCVLLVVGNVAAVRHAIEESAIPKIKPDSSVKSAADLVYASLVLDVLPDIANMKGRVEVILAGVDRIDHPRAQPALYYMDSAQDFRLDEVDTDAVAAGATAGVRSLVGGHSYAEASVAQLKVLARECMSATKLRWPEAVADPITLGVATADSVKIQKLS